VSASIRLQIIDAVVEAVRELEWVGAVLEHVSSTVEQISGVVHGGKAYVELSIGDDAPDVEENASGPVEKQFDLGLIVQLPKPLPEGETARSLADSYVQDIITLFTDPADITKRTWGGLALHTTDRGGGGVFIDEQTGNTLTGYRMRIRYRHRYGEPGTAS